MSTGRAMLAGYLEAAAAIGRPADLDRTMLERALAGLYAQGSAAHPDLAVAPASFGAHLARCNTSLGAVTGSLPAEDLFLACAAISGDARAISKIRELALPPIRSYLRRIGEAEDAAHDVAQELWNVLMAPRGEQPPTLALYSGSGSLRSFVGVVGRRLALMRCRRENVASRAAARAAIEVNAVADDVELGFIQTHYRQAFREAIESALATLDDRLRMVLRMRVVDGLTVTAIARSYGVAQASASRWLEKAREQVSGETRRLLAERLLMTKHEFDSLWRVVGSQVEISVSGVLARTAVSHSGTG